MQETNIYDEKELLIRLAAGDEAAFEIIYHQYKARLFGNLLKLVKSESMATEILQDLFIKVWYNRQQIDPNKSFRSWLFKISENLVYDFFRKAARDKDLQAMLTQSAIEYYLHVEENLITKETRELLQHAIDSLPAQRRQVFQLCKIEGKSYGETGKILGISASTISDHIVKANRTIYEYIRQHKQLAIVLLSLLFLPHP